MGEYLTSLPEAVAVRWIVAIAMAGVVLDCLETLWTARLYAPGGAFDSLSYRRSGPRIPLPRTLVDGIANQSVFVTMIALESLCAAGAIAGARPGLLIGFIFCARLLALLRHGGHGNDGSDHMLLIVLASLCIYYCAPDHAVKRFVLWFLAGESLLAYLTAGVAKALHPRWRAGSALSFIFQKDLFENHFFARWFPAHSLRGLCGCWSVIVFECLVPVFVFAGPVPCAVVLAIAAGLHLAIAASMGLNMFVFAFLATYPAVLITVQDSGELISAAARISAPPHTAAAPRAFQACVQAAGRLENK
jgi:hypothetical protein